MRPSRPVLSIVLAAALAALAPGLASAATVSGTVFNDFNTDGVRGTGAPTGAIDRGVAGLTVRAVDAAGTVIDTTTTGPAGGYSLTAPDARVRVELVVKDGYQPSRQLGTLRSDVRFVDAATAQAGIDFGVHRAAEFSDDNPQTYFPQQWAGPVTASRTQTAIHGVPFFGATGYAGTFGTLADTSSLATFAQVGTVFGLDVDQADGDLYAGAFYKRFAGLTADGTGAIFRVTQSGAATTWARLAAGADDHPTSTNVTDWFNGATKDASWPDVGKRGLGSIVIDPASRSLYTVNLAEKRLVRLSLDGAAPGTVPAGTGTVIPDPGCTGGEWQPFGAGIDPATGVLYAGGVCNAITSQAVGDLEAVVYRVGTPTATPTFTQVLRFPLTYRRVAKGSAGFNSNNSDWEPWPTAASVSPGTVPSDPARGQRSTPYGNVDKYRESYPELSDLSFDADGSMQLGFRDLMGDMSGQNVPGEITNGSAIVQGDSLRACPTGTNGFALENGGVCGGVTGFGTDPLHGGAIGPGAAHFYDTRPGYNLSGAGTIGEVNQYMGGKLQVPGFAEVATTYVDPGNQLYADGVQWQSNAGGTDTRGFTNRQNGGSPQGENVSFGKANGLGDLAAYTRQAPVQIGNRVWLDTDRDGIQDADEPVLVGVTVQLVDANGTVVDTAVTDANGEYVFTIAPNTAYTVQLPLGQTALQGLVPTGAGAGSNPLVDSNGTQQSALVLTTIAPHDVGQNDHSFDFGFAVPTPSPTPTPTPSSTPPPPGPTPTPTATPTSTPSGYNVTLTKTADKTTAAVGDEIRYTLTVHNDGPAAAPDVTVHDAVPSGLEVTGSKTDKGTCSRKGNVVDCVIGLLAPNADAHVTVVATLVKPGGVTNTGTVTAPDDSDVADDVDGATVKASAAKLVVRKVASRKRVRAGRTLRYTLVARNVGGVTARAVRLCDVLPAQLSLVTRDGGRLRSGQLCWTIASLAPGKSVRHRFRVRVDADTPTGTVVNRATVGDHGNRDDSDRAPVNVQAAAPNPAEGVTG